MAFNNVPVNGWPQIKKLEELDAIAKKVDGMPIFSSTDRDWLDEWESKLPELPADPEMDGVKVLTATTESGETTKSWEEPESSTWDYSTSEVDTGQKWTDGKSIYAKVIVLENAVNVNGNAWIENVDTIAGENCISVVALNTSGYSFPFGGGFNNSKLEILNLRTTALENIKTIICRYTKTEVQQTRKRGK